MASDPKRGTFLPYRLDGLLPKQEGIHAEQPNSQTKSLERNAAYRLGVPIKPSKLEKRSEHSEQGSATKYHKSYNIDQAGPGVIALKDVEKLPICLIKYSQPQNPRSLPKLQFASHKNIVSLIDHFQSQGELHLIYEYEHLAISLGCVAGTVSFSEADIATICKEVLEGLKYVHTILNITYGLLDFSNILLTWQGEVKLGMSFTRTIQTRLISCSKYWRIFTITAPAEQVLQGYERRWFDRSVLERSNRSTARVKPGREYMASFAAGLFIRAENQGRYKR